ncbi:MAG TPA: CHASE3 domain-containing protein [Leptolyngbyaceae cyanobacterium M33_DOE_097]|uniref:histidine kinase n=1 Tax=Oscillatoriales cyanobacterium SpSt-418 TaxID=2282169 RepID=A0A7C3PHU3_9CYAN|nr:CHASE3 domain-containing protein [Leptolyngbyaceae cyanobacterium M33_DOE_097]
MRWSLEEKVIASSLGAILLLLGLVNLMSPKNTTELVENANRVQSTYDILGSLTDFYAAMSVAESGRRGYIFSGRVEELGRHQAAVLQMTVKLNELQHHNDFDSSQKQRVQQLNKLATQRLRLFQQSLDLYQRDRSTAALQTQNSITDYSVQLREQIQSLLADIKNAENQQLQDSLEQTRTNIQYRASIERTGILLSFVVAGGMITVFLLAQKRRQKLQILEQTLAQEQEINQLKLRLFSMISHEFRTPLSVILASSQLLAEILESKIEPSQLKNLYRIQTSAKLMNRLITDILTLTRAEAGKLECKPEWLDIEAFCLNLLDDVQSSNPLKHRLHFSSEGRCGRVFLDEKLLYLILSNLLQNAIKYSSPGSQIDLKLYCGSQQVEFEVQDQGIGILERDREDIFTPFYRGQNVESLSGSGLGLAVVQKCLELQDGRIHIENPVEGGTKFIVMLPCHSKGGENS